jgi:hypothetical protein
MIRNILIPFIAIFLLMGCVRDPKPKGLLKPEKFVDILVDIYIAEGFHMEKRRIDADSLNPKDLYISVLEKHAVSEERLKITTMYYARHPREYDKIYSEVNSRMSQMIEDLSDGVTPQTQ